MCLLRYVFDAPCPPPPLQAPAAVVYFVLLFEEFEEKGGLPMERTQLYISTVAAGCDESARRHGLGLEIAEYCTAANLDSPTLEVSAAAARHRRAAERFVFHAPFNELCPAAIDPLAVELTRKRYRQALAAAKDWGCSLVVLHTGFIPTVYFPEWFVEKSVAFWTELLSEVPENMTLCLENVMEPSPQIPVDIVRGVDDPRLRLCLDVGHANAELSRTPVMDWVEACRPYLRHLHLHNNAGGWDLHDPLAKGTVPMGELLHALENEPHLTYTLETLQAEENVRWLTEEGFLKP